MKRNHLLAISCVLLSALSSAGCTAVLADGGAVPVAFEAKDAATRADGNIYIDGITNVTIPAGRSFGLYAWKGAAPSGTADFMRNQRVTNEGGTSEGYFTYSPVKYWPNDGTGLTFQAYYPYCADTEGSGITPSQSSGPASYYFIMDPDTEDHVDFLVSDILPDRKKQSPAGKVNIPFRHALAKVTFDAQLPDGATLTSITVSGLRDRGTLQQTQGNGGTTTDTWTGLSGNASYECGASGTAGVLLAVPQALTSSQTVTLTYSVTGNDGNPATTTYSAPLPTAQTDEWEEGCTYAYHLSVNSATLQLTVTVSPWEYIYKQIDYSTEVTVRNEGRIRWTPGTYSEKDDTQHTVLLGYRQTAECTFTVDTPAGSIWKAVLRTSEGVIGAFEFVDGEGSGFRTMSGDVGQPATLRIRATDDRPEQFNAAYLSIYVESGGKNIHVNTLVDDSGSEWQITQDRNT